MIRGILRDIGNLPAWVAVFPLALGLLLGFRVWPFDPSGHTVYGFACVKQITSSVPSAPGYTVSYWTLAPYENGKCTGSEHALEGGTLSFTTDFANQIVVAIDNNRQVMRLDKCRVYDSKNWACSYNDSPWTMKDGRFSGGNIFAGAVAYSDYWGWLFMGEALKPSDIQGL